MNQPAAPNYRSNPQLELAFDFLRYTGRNIFLTGKAGTGKTTFLKLLKEHSHKRLIVVAPTGVAAINAGGVTIHSFFQLPFGPQIPGNAMKTGEAADQAGERGALDIRRFSREKIRIIRSLDMLVIDEISMVRADLLDAIDDVLRRFRNRYKPFGGIQLLMIGDLQQLAPITKDDEWDILKAYYQSTFFFDSLALKKSGFVSIELKEIFRQRDQDFIDLLNKVRDNRMDAFSLRKLNSRFIPDYDAPESEGYITLTTHNYQSARINSGKLEAIDADPVFFQAEIKGEFPEFSFPTDAKLELKVGAQVMFVKNDPSPGKLFYNGKIGRIFSLDEEEILVQCPGEEDTVNVERLSWLNSKYTLNEATQEIEEEVIGVYTQFPLRLAWAITIHKSQGLTFEKAIIDARGAFAHGQVYVALSRCRSFEGLVLSSPIASHSILNDQEVARFSAGVEQNQPDGTLLEKSRAEYVQLLLAELFDFRPLLRQVIYLRRLWNESDSLLFGSMKQVLHDMEVDFSSVADVSARFEHQVGVILQSDTMAYQGSELQERVRKAAAWYQEKLAHASGLFSEGAWDCDNKAVRKKFGEAAGKLSKEMISRSMCLEYACGGFDVDAYLAVRARAELDAESSAGVRAGKKKQELATTHPELYRRLRQWRSEKADIMHVEEARILAQKSLLDIVEHLPVTARELKEIKGMGGVRMKQYGGEILTIILDYCSSNGMPLPDNARAEAEKAGMDSGQLSYELFRNGLKPYEIATSRQLALATVENHLLAYVGNGKIPISELVDPARVHAIEECIEMNHFRSVGELKAKLGSSYSFSEIKFVLRYLGTRISG